MYSMCSIITDVTGKNKIKIDKKVSKLADDDAIVISSCLSKESNYGRGDTLFLAQRMSM